MKTLLSGNEAIARGAYEAGATVATAYPGTPSTEIVETVAKYPEIYSEWAPNEKVALEVGIGASIAGARVLVAMKHVGVNVAADPLFTFSYTGVNGGLVLISAGDPGMHSSQNEQDNRYYAKFAKVPMLEPSSSQEAKDMVKAAYLLSETFDTPVMVRTTTRIAHSQTPVEMDERQECQLKEYVKNPKKYVMIPAYGRMRHKVVEERRMALEKESDASPWNYIEWGDKKIGIITSGINYQYVKEAAGSASILKLGMINPLPKKVITEFVSQVDEVYVVEELEPFIEEQVSSWGLKVIGKDVFPRTGEFSPELIAEKLLGQTGAEEAAAAAEQSIPVRPPVLCPGCPHRGMYYVINKLKLKVAGDIGCYTLGALPPLEAMDSCICMGASIGTALGMEKARGKEFGQKLVAIIGDSTFMHSGITGLLDVVYNKGTTTTIILDNRTTAMTGHQDNPGTGYTVKKEETVEVDLPNLVKALGIKRVIEVDPYDLDKVEEIMKEETVTDEPSVIIAKRPCALLDKSVQPPMAIDQDKCTGCKRCMKLGCPAIALDGEEITINYTQCNGCELCIQVCRFEAIGKAGDQ